MQLQRKTEKRVPWRRRRNTRMLMPENRIVLISLMEVLLLVYIYLLMHMPQTDSVLVSPLCESVCMALLS